MTRINLVDPSLLNTKHLIAEYKELPRIFNLVRKAIERGEKPNDSRNPTKYVLGTSHCRFFYSRLRWLQNRQNQLINECLRRGYNIQHTNTEDLVKDIPDEWFGQWTITEEAVRMNINRINERGGNIKYVDDLPNNFWDGSSYA